MISCMERNTHKPASSAGFVSKEVPRRLSAGKAADFVRQRFQPGTQAFTGIYVFKHQLLVALDEARVLHPPVFFKIMTYYAIFRADLCRYLCLVGAFVITFYRQANSGAFLRDSGFVQQAPGNVLTHHYLPSFHHRTFV